MKNIKQFESFENTNESLSKDTLEKMGELANDKDLTQFNGLLKSLTEAWINEGFDQVDVQDYMNYLVALIAKNIK